MFQWRTHATGRSVNGCVCSAPVVLFVPALTTAWLITARVRSCLQPLSPPSVSIAELHKHLISCKSRLLIELSIVVLNVSDSCLSHVSFLFSFSAPTCNVQCLNGGSCFLNARSQPKCRCPTSYNGERCEIDQCRDYCKNGGTCSPSRTGTRTHTPPPHIHII